MVVGSLSLLTVLSSYSSATGDSWPFGSPMSDGPGTVQLPGPADPYSKESTATDSVVRPVSTEGDAAVLSEGLQEGGFFCAQVRSDPASRQTWCRATEPTLSTIEPIQATTVDIVSTTEGDVQYVRINLPTDRRPGALAGEFRDPDARLIEVLGASVFRLWPAEAQEVSDLIDEVRNRSHQEGEAGLPRPRWAKLDAQHAEYFIGEGTYFSNSATVSGRPPLTFVAATDQLVNTWPSGSQHALTSAVAAAPSLEASGWDCNGEIEMPCTRVATNQQIDYSTVGGFERLVTVSLFIGGGNTSDGSFRTLADSGLPEGLPFLTETARPAVETKLEEIRSSGKAYIGVVAGALVIIDPSQPVSSMPEGSAYPVQLTVGAPLVTGFPG